MAAVEPRPVDTSALRLADRRIRLRPAGPGDLGFIRQVLDSHEQVAHDWPRPASGPPGTPPASGGAARAQWYVAHSQATGEPIGVCLGYDISDRHGRAHLGVVMDPAVVGSGLGMSAFLRLADYLFAVHPLRKIYMRSVEYSLAQYRSLVAKGYVTVEGIFVGYEYFGGRYWDLYTMAMSREQFERFRARLDRVTAAEPPG